MNKIFTLLLAVLLLAAGCSETKTPSEEPEQPTNDSTEKSALIIEGTSFDEQEIEFYTLMQRLQIEQKRAAEAKGLEGEELKDVNDYWDTQSERYNNVNLQLQTVIEIHSMSLLAEEKNYYVPDEQLEQQIDRLSEQLEANDRMKQLVAEFGEDAFRVELRPYLREQLLRDRIVAELEKTARKEQPEATDQEIRYSVNKEYEALYEDQVSDVAIEVNLQ